MFVVKCRLIVVRWLRESREIYVKGDVKNILICRP